MESTPHESSRQGDPLRLGGFLNADSEDLVPSLYKELRRLAHAVLSGENRRLTLRTTALVHEAYLRLAKSPKTRLESRKHFLGVAAKIMRHVLVDHFRKKRARKRGTGKEAVPLEDLPESALVAGPSGKPLDILALDEAMGRLAAIDERKSRIVELRFFGGLLAEEIAEVLGVSTVTVNREWLSARTWLYREMKRAEHPASGD